MSRLVFYAIVTWVAMQAILPAMDRLGDRETTIEESVNAAIRGE